jgi:hypothetical protein
LTREMTMAKPKRYWIRVTAEFDDGATYAVQREVMRSEMDDFAGHRHDLPRLEFQTLLDMLDVGIDRK